MIKNKNLNIFDVKSKEHKEFQQTLFFLLSSYVKRSDMAFYVSVINNFTFCFLKDGNKRPDIILGTLFNNNHVTLVINPQLFFKNSEQEMMFLLIHEAEHILNFHVMFDIKKNTSYNALVNVDYKYINDEGKEVYVPKKIPLATMAMDLEVNSLRYTMGSINDRSNQKSKDFLLKTGIFPLEKKFENLEPYQPWEFYYNKLLENAKKQENGMSFSSGGGISGLENIEGISNEWYQDGDYGITQLDIENFKMFVDGVLSTAMNQTAGNIPGKYISYLDEIKKTKYDWKSALRQFIATGLSSTMRSSRRRINRRAITKKVIMAGSVQERDVSMVVAIDVSGSICQEQFEASVSHLNKLRESTNTKMFILCFDGDINLKIELKKQNYKNVLKTKVGEAYSRGGTMFGPIFDAVKNDRDLQNPDVLIIFTDGFNYDKMEVNPLPKIPLLWVYTPDHQKQTFGRGIVMNDYK